MKQKKWGLWIVFGVSIIGILLLGGYLGLEYLGRQKLYPVGSEETKYPGSGEVKSWTRPLVWVSPKGVGRPEFVDYQEIDKYDPSEYEVVVVPEQDQLHYGVGRFVRWEDINDEGSKYMVLKDETGVEYKYRLGLLPSSRFGHEEQEGVTYLAVERVNLVADGERDEIGPYNPAGLDAIGREKLERMIKPNDSVVVTPSWEVPVLTRQDENGVVLAGWVIIRRINWSGFGR